MIFLSHSSKDKKLAGLVKAELWTQDFSSFLAHDDISGGADWHEEIWSALRKCHALIGLVTEAFNASAFCQQEVGAAFALEKPLLLVRFDIPAPPGFAGRFQSVAHNKLPETLATNRMFRQLRVEAWIEATKVADSFQQANNVYNRFSAEWATMTNDEKLRWLLAAASNSQVRSEGFLVGPFYQNVKKELKPHLTDQWLWDNDTHGCLHDRENNPAGK